MKVLSLFAGVGGFDLGLALAGYQICGQVEIDKYCLKILEARFPLAHRWSDINHVRGAEVIAQCGPIDLICGGFPCQDISHAGKGGGLDADRSGLWFEMLRLIGEIRPRWVIVENVAALRARGLDRVVDGLAGLDYGVRTFGIRAGVIGAGHERKRIWIVANDLRVRERGSHGQGQRGLRARDGSQTSGQNEGSASQIELADPESLGWPEGCRIESDEESARLRRDQSSDRCNKLDDAEVERLESRWQGLFAFPNGPSTDQQDWESPRTIESEMGVTANGLPLKLALRAVGNAVVPAIPYAIGRAIQRIEFGGFND